MSIKKKIITSVIVVVIIVFLIGAITRGESNGYATDKVKRATITQSVSETGNIDTGASVTITSPSTGIVEEVYVANGQTVTQGELLFKVKSTATEQEKQATLANYLTAKAALDGASASEFSLRSAMYSAWDTYYNMATGDNYENPDGSPKTDMRTLPEFTTAQQDWFAAEAKLKNQQNVVSQAKAQVSSTWLLYQATQNAEVKANADGTIANLSLSRNDDIKAADNALTIVSAADSFFVKVAINEIDIPKINPGQKVKVEIDAIDNAIFEGTVSRVDSIGTNTQGVITYFVYVTIQGNNTNLRSGMTANVEIETETVQNALSVPNTAVKPYQGGRAIQILENGKPKYIPVKIGVRGDTLTQIIEGISEGQEVITGAKNDLIKRSGSFGF